jgi:DNA-binding beta-propeller fold protein YncE
MQRAILFSPEFTRGWRGAPGPLMLAVFIGLASMADVAVAQAPSAPLVPDGSVVLPDTSGRIDHMAIDLPRRHLFVAELGNGSLDVVDLAAGKVIHRITGLKEPQGIAYDAKSDSVIVASGGDGTVRAFSGKDFTPRGVLTLGGDADNLRIDPRNDHVIVGYGDGALAVIDPVEMRKLQEIPLAGHPESFRLSGNRVFINVPDAGQIVAADIDTAKIVNVWRPAYTSNFPMILTDSGDVGVGFRGQSKLALLDPNSGAVIAAADTCGDADDLFFDARRKYFYVSCGSGAVDVISRSSTGLRALSRIRTSPGARTSLFVPQLDRLFVAARAGILGSAASILILRTAPQ